jgi:hypothetical protein
VGRRFIDGPGGLFAESAATTVDPAYKDVLLLYLIRIIEAFLEIGALTS